MTTHHEYSRDSYPANKHVLQKVKGVKGHLLCRIYWATNLKDRVCRMGLKRLGAEIGFDPSTASRAGKALVEDGYIVKVKEADLTKSESPHYKVTQKFFDLLQNATPIADDNSPPIAERKTPIAECKQEKETEKETTTTLKEGASAAPIQPIKETTKPDKTKKPAAVHAYRQEAHLYPPKSWWGKLDDAIGNNPDKITLWARVVSAWVGSGWNPRNVKGMLECFNRGEIPGTKGNGNGTHSAKTNGHKNGIHSTAERQNRNIFFDPDSGTIKTVPAG